MLCDVNSEVFRKIGEIVGKGGEFEQITGDDVAYQQFLKEYPPESLQELNLKQYCLGKGSEDHNFCWWTERGLEKALGRYMPGTSKGHLLYFKKDGGTYITKYLKHLGEEGALKYVLKVHATIARANPDEDITWIDDDAEVYKRSGVDALQPFAEGRKLRTLVIYHPDKVLPIQSVSHLHHFLKVLGVPASKMPHRKKPVASMLILKQCYEEVRSRFNERLTPYGFMHALYSEELGIRPVRDEETDYDEDHPEYHRAKDPDFESPLNQILFGPPGTGKTYATTALAVKIADPEWYKEQYDNSDWDEFNRNLKLRYEELCSKERIVFTTFHQSFSYEDFVEGIRAAVDDDGQGLRYAIEDGIFRRICDNADKRVIKNEALGEKDISKRTFWKMSLGNTQKEEEAQEIFTECIENNYVLLGWGGNIDFTGCDNDAQVKKKYQEVYPEESRDFAFSVVNTFKNVIKNGDIIIISSGNSRYQAIAEVTGNYKKLADKDREWFFQSREVRWLKVYEKPRSVGEIYDNNFTQKTIHGLKSAKLKYNALSDLLSPEKGASEPLPYVLIIDEINRGNISRIFGELITLLEPDKRKGGSDERKVVLPYSKTPFQVPDNVYVIGTMNTADKSLAQLDLALRRRFSFIHTPPKPQLLRGVYVYDVNLEELLSTINQRIEVLLDADHLLGHSYLLSLKNIKGKEERAERLGQIFRDNIIPLLQEYFFDDWERIRWVLNDHRKSSKEYQFILTGGDTALERLFGDGINERITERRYGVNPHVFGEPEAYRGILNGSSS